MLEHTFCHVPRISSTAEARLWAAGFLTWEDVLRSNDLGVPRIKLEALVAKLEESERALRRGEPHFFASGLNANQHWRIFPDFRQRLAYLDIETTGLNGYADKVTTIALYDGERIRYYIQGDNLAQFKRDLRDYDIVVTYNGKCFDIPFLNQNLGVRFPQVHLDLRYILKRLGFSGGLKGCERMLGYGRGDLEGVDGFMAVVLWSEYQNRRNEQALETLLSYNIQDVLSLEWLLVEAYNRNLAGLPFEAARRLPKPVQPANPFRAHGALVQAMMRHYNWRYQI